MKSSTDSIRSTLLKAAITSGKTSSVPTNVCSSSLSICPMKNCNACGAADMIRKKCTMLTKRPLNIKVNPLLFWPKPSKDTVWEKAAKGKTSRTNKNNSTKTNCRNSVLALALRYLTKKLMKHHFTNRKTTVRKWCTCTNAAKP